MGTKVRDKLRRLKNLQELALGDSQGNTFCRLYVRWGEKKKTRKNKKIKTLAYEGVGAKPMVSANSKSWMNGSIHLRNGPNGILGLIL